MPSKKHHNKPASQVNIAKRRIRFLFDQAKDSFKNDSKLANKNIKLARRLAMKYKISLPSELKKKFCKHCHSYLVPGINCRVRIHKHRVIYYCLSCKYYIRHPIRWYFLSIPKIILDKRKLYILVISLHSNKSFGGI